MAKSPKTPKRRKVLKPASKAATPLTVDRENVAKLEELANGEACSSVVRSTPTVSSDEGRRTQILRSFFQSIDFDTLEADVEAMNELQMIVNRRGDDEASGAVGRVIELLEALQDTGETCGFNSGK